MFYDQDTGELLEHGNSMSGDRLTTDPTSHDEHVKRLRNQLASLKYQDRLFDPAQRIKEEAKLRKCKAAKQAQAKIDRVVNEHDIAAKGYAVRIRDKKSVR